MIAAAWRAEPFAPDELTAISRTLTSGEGAEPTASVRRDFSLWSCDVANSGGKTTLFFGRIDDEGDTARRLGLPVGSSGAAIYAAALDCWGDDADFELTGHYCAITVDDDALRLVRSPWTAPPLHFVADGTLVAASPILSAIFACGMPKRIDWDHLADQLAFDHHANEPVGWYQGINRVPIGTRVTCRRGSWSLDRYYDPVAVEPVRLSSDREYVERAWCLLEDAARSTVAGIEKPALMLSGGLDSPLAALALLRIIPEEQRLTTLTFGPHPDWDGYEPPGFFGDERERVRRFAVMHPRIDPHFPDPRDGGHDHRLRDLLALTEVPSANVANIGIFHPLFETARNMGCDGVLTALHGNFTISLDGDWAAAEAFRNGQWRRLMSVLGGMPADEGHSFARRFLSRAVLPHLPRGLQRTVRQAFHPGRAGNLATITMLSDAARKAWQQRARRRGSHSALGSPTIAGSRAQAIRWMWASADSAEDLDLGMERLHGVSHRDITAYRPLFEFCHGLPADQFVRHGTDRYLARRMAEGLLPEAQRTDTRQGRHNVDWHARMARRQAALLSQTQSLGGHARLGRILDSGRMARLLREWPDRTPTVSGEALPRMLGLTRALTAAAFVSHAEKRNDF